MNKRMNRSRLNMGVYHLRPYARTEKHIRELADCGVDFVLCMENDRPTLDLFNKYGIGAIVYGIVPGWWGGNGETSGKMADLRPLSTYSEAAVSFEDHPAIWGIDVGDEPSALDFPHYGKVIDCVNHCFKNQFAYLNLYPNYASVSQNSEDETICQLGTKTYSEHIEKYCRYIPSDYICYDFYMFSINVQKAYDNLKIVADACLRTGRSMWIVLQVNSNDPEYWISEDNLRFQAYSAMAFGAENIIWACYTAGWWNNQVLDENGEKTEQYEKLKLVNSELRALGETYMKYRRVSTHFVGFSETDYLSEVKQEPIDSLDTGIFMDVHAENGESLVIGQMVSRNADGSYALMICAADDPYGKAKKEYRILFRTDNRSVKALCGNIELPIYKHADGSCSIKVSSCMGVLLTAE